MKVNILSTGRFHVLDLARELSLLGHDVRFYTYVPQRRCAAFGLNPKIAYSYLWFAAPFLLLRKLFPKSETIQRLEIYAIDYFVSLVMRDADICIGLGSIFNHSLSKAKSKGQVYILEWGSMHIEDQLKLFQKKHPQWSINRELWEYEQADYISVPAEHVAATFITHGIPESKLLVNPYGVSLSQFYPTCCTNEFDVITVGGWRYEKGSELLIGLAKEHPEISILHVGTIVNLDFPDLPNMHHIDSINQKDLVNYYSTAKVFALPSRAEGLSLVQAQAIACGLPVICSKYTGGSTLKTLLSDTKWIVEMSELSVPELYDCVMRGLKLSNTLNSPRNYIQGDIQNLEWSAYGKRYSENLLKILK